MGANQAEQRIGTDRKLGLPCHTCPRFGTQGVRKHLQPMGKTNRALTPKGYEIGHAFGERLLGTVRLTTEEPTDVQDDRHKRLTDGNVAQGTSRAAMHAIRRLMTTRTTSRYSDGMGSNTEFILKLVNSVKGRAEITEKPSQT